MKRIILITLTGFMCLQHQSAIAMQGPTEQATNQLLRAATGGDFELIITLVSKGASVNVKRDTDGNTPLHLAVSNGPTQSEITAAYDERDRMEARMGETPDEFVYAFPSTATIKQVDNYLKTIQALRQAGALVATKNRNGQTPLDLAKMNGQPTVIIRALE